MQNLDVSTIVFAIVAIFVVFKLRSVLGTRTGPSGRPIDPTPPRARRDFTARRRGQRRPARRRRASGRAAPRRRAPIAGRVSPSRARRSPRGFDAIAAADRGFAPDRFIAGARAAYEMIVGAFAAGDLTTLAPAARARRPRQFRQARSRRAAPPGRTMTTTLVSIDCGRYRRGAGRGLDRRRRRAFRRQARLRDARRGRRGGRGIGDATSPTISTSGPSRATSARAIPTGCWRRPNRSLSGAAGPSADEAAAPRRDAWRRLTRFDDLDGFDADDALAAFAAFARSARALVEGAAPMRPARAALAAPRRDRARRPSAPTSATPPTARDFFVDALSRLSRRRREADGSGLPHRLLRAARQGLADARRPNSPRRSSRGPRDLVSLRARRSAAPDSIPR